MAIYFTHNQYLKAAEEDFEAAEIIFGHKYYDQVASLCALAMTKYLKGILEAIYPNSECVAQYSTEDKIVILKKIKEKLPDIDISDEECHWMDKIYGKANCTDGIHVIMPKHTAVDAFKLTNKIRKMAKVYDKEAADKKLYTTVEL